MTWIALLALATIVATSLALWCRQRGAGRRCPTCMVDLVPVARAGEGPNATYDVLACPRCTFTATQVDGVTTHTVACPTCSHRSLEVPTVRVAGLPPRVGVREQCGTCGHERSFTVAAEDERAGNGKVIPFPGSPRDRRHHDHSAK